VADVLDLAPCWGEAEELAGVGALEGQTDGDSILVRDDVVEFDVEVGERLPQHHGAPAPRLRAGKRLRVFGEMHDEVGRHAGDAGVEVVGVEQIEGCPDQLGVGLSCWAAHVCGTPPSSSHTGVPSS
jgi:hypothetical protein